MREKRLALYRRDVDLCPCILYIHTHTYTERKRNKKYMNTRRCTLLSTYGRLEFFYKYYKETVISRARCVYRRDSKEGLITQAPFLRLLGMRKMIESARERLENKRKRSECACEYECVRVKGREKESV